MSVLTTDISYVLSGGSSNTLPADSLGGDPSSHPILMKTLFNDVTENQVSTGRTDYRCFYIFNDNDVDSLFLCQVYIAEQVEEGATVYVGIPLRTETQLLTINGTISGGSITLTYDGVETAAIAYDASTSIWGTNIANALNTLTALANISVEVTTGTGTISFLIKFAGVDNYRFHPLLTTTGSYTGETSKTLTRSVGGSPINSIADEIEVETTTPAGITWLLPSEFDPISVGTLGPGEGFPVWLKRVVDSNADGVGLDGVTIRFRGSQVEP